MSAPLAGKFVDHYVILGVDPGADNETIQTAYMKLQEKYSIGTPEAREKLEALHAAFETLSDPYLRKEFDAIKGVSSNSGKPMFTGMSFFSMLGQEVGLRGALLSVLYDRRRSKPFTPALSMRQLESILDASVEAMNFALWYLKQRGFVGADDKSSLLITVAGMDFLEHNRPNPEEVMPFIRPSAIMNGGQAQAAEAYRQNAPRPESAKPELHAVEEEATVAESSPAAPQANTSAANQPEGDRPEPRPTRQDTHPQPVATRSAEPQRAPRPKLDGASVRSMLNRTLPTR
jgi:curved DNA-binding protein CbpA